MAYPRDETYRVCVVLSYKNQWSLLYKLIVKPVVNSAGPPIHRIIHQLLVPYS